MADRTRLGGTTLRYLAVQQAMVCVHRPIHLKIALTYVLTWQTDHCTSQRMVLRIKRQGGPVLGFTQVFLIV